MSHKKSLYEACIIRAEMRLDEYLVIGRAGLIRGLAAKRLIERGSVKVDGTVQIKPSHKVNYGQQVTIEGEDEPQGYFKLKGIQDATGLIHDGRFGPGYWLQRGRVFNVRFADRPQARRDRVQPGI